LDNLTHSLVGLFLARAGFRRATPYGTAILVLAANAPDIDVVSGFWGRATWLHWHRNITHSLVGAPVMAILTVAMIALLCRKRKILWWPAFLIALTGVASHLILDLTNVYGVRLLLPFSGHWSHWDITPVLDFSIWALLLLGVAAPALSRLVGSEIGETGNGKIGKSKNAGWAVTALLLLTVYDYTRSVFHERATNIMNSRIYNELAPRRVGAFPTANPLVWRGIAELSNAYVEVPVDLRTDFHPSDAVTYYKPPRTAAMRAAMETYPFRMLLEFVQWPLWVIQPGRVSLIDLRFGTPSEAGFAATAAVDDDNRVLQSSFGLGEVKAR
jgi:inner membrane protein